MDDRSPTPQPQPVERIGFIGLGDIGSPMAMRIVAAGRWPVTVHNRTPDKTSAAVGAGAVAASTPADVARRSDIVFVCVTDGAAVEQVVFGPGGVMEGAHSAMMVVDLSTIHPLKAQEMAARSRREHDVAWVDAPVSGGSIGARAGTLAVMAGGAAADVERVRPVLMSFAARVTHMGDSGCGMATKACNQMINCGTAAVVAEALNLAHRFGVDAAKLPQALAGGFADSTVLQTFGPRMVSQTFRGDTRVTLKDINIVLDLGRLTDSAMPITGVVASFYRMLASRGLTHDGFSGVMRMYAEGPLLPRGPTT